MLKRSRIRNVTYATWVYTLANVPRSAAGVAAHNAAEDVAPLHAATC